MTNFKSLFFLLAIVLILAGGSVADAENYIDSYTTGKVTEYIEGKTIDIMDDVGDSHTYLITDDTDMPEKIEEGMTVEVSAENVLAIKIEDLSSER